MKYRFASLGGRINKTFKISPNLFKSLFGSLIVVVLVLPATLYSQEPENAPAADPKELLRMGDEAWEKRGTRLDTDNARAVDYYRAAAKAEPFSYDAHWKCARAIWWLSDQMLDSTYLKKEDHKKLGKEGMEMAGRAKLINPDGIEGHLYFALTAFHYAFGIGVIDAMKEGVFDSIYEDLLWCHKREKGCGGGAVCRGLSAYYRIVPWPARDNKKSVDFAEDAVRAGETSIRNMTYLAAAYEINGMTEEAKGVLETAVEMEGDREVEPDFKRWKRFGKSCIKEGRVIDTEMLF
jgi:hypothetical protein